MAPGNSETFTTADGKDVWLSCLMLRRTYEGCLEGDAQTCSFYMREDDGLADSLRKEFPHLQAVLIFDEMQLELPDFSWRALLKSRSSVAKDPDFASQLGVGWFTDTLTDGLESFLREMVARIEWTQSAEDYNAMP